MANKTIQVIEPGLIGGTTTGLTLKLRAENSATVVNGSGDSLTYVGDGLFTATVTEALSGIYTCAIYDGSELLNDFTAKAAKVWIPGDVAGTYTAGSEAELNKAAFTNQLIPILTRTVDDTNSIGFYWPIASATITGTVSIDFGSYQSVAGAFSYIGTAGDLYEYRLAFNAADRPTDTGNARYILTDGTNTKRLTLQVLAIQLTAEESAKIALIGTGAGVISSPVYRGKIESIVIGDAYLRANGDDFEFTIPDPGLTASITTVWFGGNSSTTATSWLVQGTITDNGTTWTLSFELTSTITAALDCGYYKWSVATRDASNNERTRVSSNGQEVTALMHKQTDGSDPNC